jgi:hypothetical protein
MEILAAIALGALFVLGAWALGRAGRRAASSDAPTLFDATANYPHAREYSLEGGPRGGGSGAQGAAEHTAGVIAPLVLQAVEGEAQGAEAGHAVDAAHAVGAGDAGAAGAEAGGGGH